ncbi:DcuS/MalK family sensor histidine kinase [Domibacillus indicus]|uniref:DcuS/MalK family sensor histidine kinase n=1 Tax=Domibacillus indicus TaxID=1437523 RepID=UPI0006180A44|nr:DcuS/MalK family sensor histidine kinase [Domibacillus indicus]
MKKGRWSLRAIIIAFVCAVVAFSLLITDILITKTVTDSVEEGQIEKAQNASRIMARTPLVAEALTGRRDEADIQLFADDIREATGVQFVVVMDMNGIRKSHPDPGEIGKPFAGGDEQYVLNGEEYISTAEGTLGPSIRSFTPVLGEDGEQIGAVAVGISTESVQKAAASSRNDIYIGTLAGIAAGIIGAILLARYIKRVLLGLEPFAIARLLKERSAMLQSVHEGIIAVDRDSTITLMNKAAKSLFQKEEDGPVPLGSLQRAMETEREKIDEEQRINGVELLVNSVPIHVGGTVVGAIATYRDKTEVKQLAEQLTGVRLYADALRAQTHEFMNKLHVILGMVQMKSYEELASFIRETVDFKSNEIQLMTEKIKDPVLAGFLVGKLSYAREAGVNLFLRSDYPIPPPEDPSLTHDLITVVGNLIDNAIDAVENSSKKTINVSFSYGDDILTIEVADSGPGVPKSKQQHLFEKGYSTKGTGRGIGLALVKGTLEQRAGEFDFLSEPGKGMTFTVYIPFQEKGEKT